MAKVVAKVFKLKEQKAALEKAKLSFAEKVHNGMAPKQAMAEVKAELAAEHGAIDWKGLWAIIGPILMQLLQSWLTKVT